MFYCTSFLTSLSFHAFGLTANAGAALSTANAACHLPASQNNIAAEQLMLSFASVIDTLPVAHCHSGCLLTSPDSCRGVVHRDLQVAPVPGGLLSGGV